MNWAKIASTILRFRVFFLIVILGLTCFMALQVSSLQMDYGYSGMMPESDSISINLEEFKKAFGRDATLFLFGIQDSKFFTLDKFNDWIKLRKSLIEVDGIESAYSVSEAVSIKKRPSDRKFEFLPIFSDFTR